MSQIKIIWLNLKQVEKTLSSPLAIFPFSETPRSNNLFHIQWNQFDGNWIFFLLRDVEEREQKIDGTLEWILVFKENIWVAIEGLEGKEVKRDLRDLFVLVSYGTDFRKENQVEMVYEGNFFFCFHVENWFYWQVLSS